MEATRLSNELIISSNATEVNIALLEDRGLVELNKEKTTYIATVGEVVYVYYYSAREGDTISVDTNYEYLLDFDGTPFTDDNLYLTSL